MRDQGGLQLTGDVCLSVDIGGTFTDVVLRIGDELHATKTLTTHDGLQTGFFRGVDAVLGTAGLSAAEVDGFVVHATTVVTNALIERKGSRTALIVTEGFRDVLRFRDERRYDVYDPQLEFPRPLIEDGMTFTLAERVLADGSIARAPDAAEVVALARRLVEAGAESVGICFLNSYTNPQNEQQVAAILTREVPGLHVSVSSEIAPQIREYLRASTVAANAYAVPITQPYLEGLARTLKERGFASQALIMLSSGGTVGAETAGRMPVRMVESGPAAGALGAALIARALRLDNLLAFDMGGTTAKVCLIQDHKPMVTGLFEIDRMFRFKEGSGLPVIVPCIDLIEIGAGGGSLADCSDLGLLKVGPQSAGSMPGPVAYGRGGTQPTVTDANVVLGLVDAGGFLGGTMALDAAGAEAALAALGARLGYDARETARGIYRIVTEAMAGAVRAHAAERGIDSRGTPLLGFGGAGPLHACEVARLLHSTTVIFPPHASVFSAFGALLTPLRLDLVRSDVTDLATADWGLIERMVAEMEAEGRRVLGDAGCPPELVRMAYELDMRYLGQQHELKVDLPGRLFAAAHVTEIRAAFEAEYLKTYRLTQPEVGVEIVSVRVVAQGRDRPLPDTGRVLGAAKANGRAAAPATRRPAWLWPGQDSIAIHARHDIGPETRVIGPAVIEEAGTTLVIPPGWSAELGDLGCIVARATQE